MVYFHSNDLEARQRMERRRLEEVHREELQLHDGLSESLLHIYGASLVPKVVGTVLMVFLLTRVVNRGRFFEEGGQQRALFRRGRSTEGAFSKRAVNRGRFFEEDDQQRARGIDGGQQKAPLLRRAIFLRARAVKVRPALLAERAVRSRALLFMRTPVRRALSQLP